MVWDRLVKLELNTPKPVGNVHIVDALDENSPGVRVVVWNAGRFGICLFVEGSCCCSVDEGSEYLHALDALACGWCHCI